MPGGIRDRKRFQYIVHVGGFKPKKSLLTGCHYAIALKEADAV